MIRRFGRWIAATDAWIYGLAIVVTSVTTVFALQLWKANLGVPLTYRGDALPTGAHFKTIFEEGWYEYQPRLGAPFGQTYNDFPTADNLHMIAAKILRLFTSDWAVAINAYFLLGFLLIAIAAVWFLRLCRVSPWLTIALATLYAIAPYHFLRGESHLWLSSYYAVPLALGLLVFVVRGAQLWALHPTRTGVLRWVLSPALRTVLIVALLATSSSYYAVFFLALLAPAGIFTLVRDKNWRRFWGAAAAGGVTVVVMLINMLPDLLFSWTHGQNPLGLDRSGGEAEYYALKLSQLILPWSGHRIGLLSNLRQRYDAAYVSLGEQPALGAIGAIGFIAALLIIAYLAFARLRPLPGPDGASRFPLIASLSGLVFVAFIYSTLGGLSTIISIFTTSIRGWNRMSIVIAGLSLAIVGLLVDAAISRWSKRKPSRSRLVPFAAGGAALLLLVVGFVDQTPGDSDREYASNSASFLSDETYFTGIQSSLPDDAAVLLLPYIPFPESNGATGLLASDQLVPYLHTTTVRWSNGGIKGRPTADWPGELAQYGPENVAALAAGAGFDGVLVDRAAATDGGTELESALSVSTGARPVVNESGRFAFYPLAGVRAELAATQDAAWFDQVADSVTDPVISYRTPGFSPAEEFGSITTNAGAAQFSVVNAAEVARDVVVSFHVPGASGRIDLTLPDGTVVSHDLAAGGTDVTQRLTVQPGTHLVGIAMFGDAGNPLAEITLTQPQTRNLDIVALLAKVAP